MTPGHQPAKKCVVDLPIPYFPIEEIAVAWQCTLDNLYALQSAGLLEIVSRPHRGGMRDCIVAAERDRVEANHEFMPEPHEHPGKVATLEFLLGMALHIYYSEDPAALDAHHVARDMLIGDGVTALEMAQPKEKGQTVFRTRETDANAIRDAIKRFRESGLYEPRELRLKRKQIAKALQRSEPMKSAGSEKRKAV